MAVNVNIASYISNAGFSQDIALQQALQQGHVYFQTGSWATDVETLRDAIMNPTIYEYDFQRPRFEAAMYERNGVIVRCILADGRLNAKASGKDKTRVESALHALRRFVPPASNSSNAQEVQFIFWNNGPHGVRSHDRKIEVPQWTSIAPNYPERVAAALENTMLRFRPAHGGQLVLWHGSPGTGKTYAIRAASWEWRNWCRFEYVTDPEQFFGDANYMMHALLRDPDDDEPIEWDDIEAAREDAGIYKRSKHRWRCLVLEDTGELISADAKQRTGQGMSRLLNVVDGIIGQGLKVLVLITTNENVRDINEAIARPGRCASEVEFQPFKRDEAIAWFNARGHSLQNRDGRIVVNKTSMTLAEMFAIVDNMYSRQPDKQRMGFVA